ncbi:MAG: DUF1549 domain-containing protein [Planctomycetes bacterium]|nr:DUF1549 domain-containing protein [Planctomycetota bacterium]
MSHRRRFSWTALAALALVAAAVSAPRASADGPKDWRAAAAKVDGLVASKFRAQKDLVVAPLADDAEYLRRVTMDLTGTIPTYDETVSFLQDTAPDKRSALVDRLLASRRHADWFAMWYSNLLVGTATRNRNLDRRTFNDWLRDQFRKNRPYDELVYDLVTATGNSETNGATGLLASFETSAADAAGKTSRFFLGVQIQCAQCHDHPYDKRIKQQDFADYAAFFFTTTYRRNMTPGNPEISFDVSSLTPEPERSGRPGDMTMMPGRRTGIPLTLEGGRPQLRGRTSFPEAKFLLGKQVKDVAGIDRRTVLAKWMTSKTNPWFAQAFANRMWAFLMGRGIVHPVDDFSSANKPTNPELLDFLADELVRSGFDVSHLVRVITGTEAYQRTSKMPRGVERPDPSLFAVAAVKPLTVEQSFDALFRATGAEKQVERLLEARERAGAEGRRTLQDPRMAIYQLFRRSFDDDEQSEEETFTGTIPRGLLMMNGEQVNRIMGAANPDSPLARVLSEERSDRERVRRVYLTVLSRDPSPGELSNALQHVHTSRTEKEGYEDLLWALCNTTEFMSNH